MNIVDHNAAPTNAPGIESFKKRIKAFHAAFPDLRYTIENLIAEGDQVVAHVTITGTHKGEFMGMAPSKKVFTINAIDIVRVVNGMWVEYRGTIDNLAMMQQLGLIAMPSDKKKSTGKKSIT